MFHKKGGQWLRYFMKSQLLLFLALVVLVVVSIWPLTKNYRQKMLIDREIATLKAEIAKAQSQNSDFKKIITYLESDQFAEEQARLNLNLKKPGENVVSLKDAEVTELSDQDKSKTEAVVELKAPFSVRISVNRWLDYFFGEES